MREPNFENLLKVLRREVPDRPTLFDFFMNFRVYEKLAGKEIASMRDEMWEMRLLIHAFKNGGYDYAMVRGSNFEFPKGVRHADKTVSLNDAAVITDRESFEKLPWTEPEDYDYSALEKAAEMLPDGMKLVVWGPGGVQENVIDLMGFDRLCYMLVDDPDLVQDVFDAVGSRLVRYYEICAQFDTVGALVSNDDWGFKTQTMLSPSVLRKYVFPWHKKIVEVIHAAGKPAILHSCGNLEKVMDDIIDDMKYDGKHSFEDAILPVEEAYERWGSRIAILGGIDMDFLCRQTPEAIKARARAMLERTKDRGGYALGTGNSVPYYVPDENFFAMISVVNEY